MSDSQEKAQGYGDAYIESMKAMNDIVAEMKEIPVLPSEVPKDVSALQRVEMRDGILTYMDNHDYPYRGFPFHEFVEKIDLIKKVCRQIQSGMYHSLKDRSSLELKLLIPLIPTLGKYIFYAFTYAFYRLIERSRIKTKYFSKAVREIHRACSVNRLNETERVAELRKMLRDIECMILEFDNAYRYRAQDILVEFNKEALKKNPIDELIRVLDLMVEREIRQEVKDTWTLLKMFVKHYMRYEPEIRNLIVDVICEMDMERIKLTIEDKYFAEHRDDYKFGFITQC